MRRARLLGGPLAGALLLTSCSQGGTEVTYETEGSPAPSGSVSGSASEAASPSTGGSASAGATAGAGTGGKDREPRVVETVASGLAVPWGLAFFPNGDALVTERDTRRVLRISGPRHVVEEVGVIEEAAPQGEAGLLGVALSPRFDRDRFVYLYVSTAEDNRVVRARLEGGRLGETEPVLTGIPNASYHDGGRIEFGPDGYLYVSTGEIGERERAQDKKDLAGKILRITRDGDPAPGNPFGSPVWSYGHRNVQGLAFVGRRLWASEFGEATFDELNLIEAGENYGWPEVEGPGGTDAGYVDPQVTWDTDEASPSGLAYADGHLWLAALRGERLWRVPVDGDRAGKAEPYFVGKYGRMRTVAFAPDGSLWVTTSNQDGRGEPVAEDDRILRVRP